MEKEKQSFEERIAEKLFTDGRGIEAIRLVHEQGTKLQGPGLCKQVVVDIIRKEEEKQIAALKADNERIKTEAIKWKKLACERQNHEILPMRAKIEELKAEIERKDELLRDVLNSGRVNAWQEDDERIGYVDLQVDKSTLAEIKAMLENKQ